MADLSRDIDRDPIPQRDRAGVRKFLRPARNRAHDHTKAPASAGVTHLCRDRDADAWTVFARAGLELEIGHMTRRPGHDDIDQQLVGAKRRLVMVLDEISDQDIPLAGWAPEANARAECHEQCRRVARVVGVAEHAPDGCLVADPRAGDAGKAFGDTCPWRLANLT